MHVRELEIGLDEHAQMIYFDLSFCITDLTSFVRAGTSLRAQWRRMIDGLRKQLNQRHEKDSN